MPKCEKSLSGSGAGGRGRCFTTAKKAIYILLCLELIFKSKAGCMRWFWINKALRVVPGLSFWQGFLAKLISLIVSLKVHILVTATWLLYIGKISDTVWSTVIVSIALGRIVVQSVVAKTLKKPPLASTGQTPPKDDIIVD